MRFALEHQNPVVSGAVTGDEGYPATQFSLMEISDPAVLLWALKPHQDGIDKNGIVARFWNMDDNQSDCVVSVPEGEILSAKEITHIETPVGDMPIDRGAFTASLAPQQMKSFGIRVSLK